MQVEKSANDWKQQGNKHFKNQSITDAIKCYTKAIQLNPSQPSYYSNRAACYLQQKKFDQTVQDCNKAVELDPGFTKALRRRALAYMNQLRFDESIADFKAALATDKDLTIQRQLEDCQALQKNHRQVFEGFAEGNYSQALLSLNYILGKVQAKPDLLLIKCELLAKTGDTDEAKNVLRQIESSGGSHTDISYLKGLVELYSGDGAKAKRHFQEGLKYDPDNEKLKKILKNATKGEQLKEKGNELLKAQSYKQAIEIYTEALLIDPSNKKLNSILFSNRSLAFMKQKQLLRALDDLNKSLQLDPKYIKSLVRRAQVHTQRADYSLAIQDYSSIQQIDPTVSYASKIKQLRAKQKQARKKDYYGIMGLTKPSDDNEIKKAYKKLAVQFHPDKNRHKSEAEQQDAEKKFRDLNEAYGVLTDAQKKQMYDSGQMQYDGDDSMGGMGGMGGGNFHFNSSGGGMGGMDMADLLKMFGGGGFGGFGDNAFGSGGGGKKFGGGFGGNPFGGMGGGKGAKFTYGTKK